MIEISEGETMTTWTDEKGDTLVIITQAEAARVRISPANDLKSLQITIPLKILQEMVNNNE